MKEIRKPNFIESISMVLVLIGLVVYSVIVGVSIIPALTLAVIYSLFIAYRLGFTYDKMMELVSEKLKDIVNMFLVILAIGVFVGSMMFSGTIPVVNYYLINIISPSFMVVLSFLLTAIVSILIGTSWGTAGTVGVIMIAIADSMGIPLPIVVGAVASGSHVGQLLSPMADTTNIAAGLAKTDVLTMIKRLAYIAIPAILLSIVAYLVIGFTVVSHETSLDAINVIRTEIKTVFNTNPLVILPIILVFYLTFKKQPILKTLILSSVVALIFGIIFNGFSLKEAFETFYNGFNLTRVTGDNVSHSEVFLRLVNRGGATSMIDAAILIVVATIYGTILTKTSAMNVIASTLFSKFRGRTANSLSTIFVSLMVTSLASNNFLANMIPTELFSDKYEEEGMDRLDLLACSTSTSTQVITIIPWCDTAIFIAGLSGVSTLSSLPYNFLGFGTSLIAIFLAILGIGYKNGKRLKKLDTIEEVKA